MFKANHGYPIYLVCSLDKVCWLALAEGVCVSIGKLGRKGSPVKLQIATNEAVYGLAIYAHLG